MNQGEAPPPLPSNRQEDAPERYFQHDADIGVVGRGRTPAEAFADAARSMFAITCDLSQVEPAEAVDVVFDEDDLELALVTWLNRLVAEAQSRKLALAEFDLQQQSGRWVGRARGEPWRPEFERGVEVKGATLTMLSVERKGDEWEARCVVDV